MSTNAASVTLSVYEPGPRKKGFWEQLGLPPRGTKLHIQLNDGLAYKVYTRLAKAAGLESKELARLASIPPATLQRRAKAGKFNVEESDRLYRFAEMIKSAQDLFEGDTEAALEWLFRSAKGLGGRRPVDMIRTSAETNAVLELIGRLEFGVSP